MKTKTLPKEKINVVTLGCPKNLVDSEKILAQLKLNNFQAAHENEQDNSHIVIINTCGFIDKAKEESINTILEYADAKKQGKINKLYVTGCLFERYRSELQKEITGIDGWFGLGEVPELVKRIGGDYKKELIGERVLGTPGHYAYLKISEGCDRKCSFCVIPAIRGRQTSRTIEEIVAEANNLSANGVKELILIAQELTSYGLDIYGKRQLPELLKQLSEVDGIGWIRLHYTYPAGFPLEILEIIREKENICNYIDLPLQHTGNKILKAMKRQITKERIQRLVSDIRQRIPGVAIRTTMLVGFPGESEADFKDLLDFIEEVKFERLGVFEYSHEEGTSAYQLKDSVPETVKIERAATLMNLQQEISLTHNQNKIGQFFKVIFDRQEGVHLIGRTEFDSPEIDNEVLVKSNTNRVGEFGEVVITGASEFDLYGEFK